MIMKKFGANRGNPYVSKEKVVEPIKPTETPDTIEETLEQHIDPKEENWKARREKKKLASRSVELENRD